MRPRICIEPAYDRKQSVCEMCESEEVERDTRATPRALTETVYTSVFFCQEAKVGPGHVVLAFTVPKKLAMKTPFVYKNVQAFEINLFQDRASTLPARACSCVSPTASASGSCTPRGEPASDSASSGLRISSMRSASVSSSACSSTYAS